MLRASCVSRTVAPGAWRAKRACSDKVPKDVAKQEIVKATESKDAHGAEAPTSSGLLSSLMASMMKQDVRAAYQVSQLPLEKQREFLKHVREQDAAQRLHEIEKLREQGKTDLVAAKARAEAALEELKLRRQTEEEKEQSSHLRQLEVLEKETSAAAAASVGRFKYQKWKAVAEREKRLRVRAEELARREEHELFKKRLEMESKSREAANNEQLRVEQVRHQQALELEAAKASAAKERLKENTAAIKLGPDSALKEMRSEERQREEAQREEREKQREHERELHNTRLREAEQRALEAATLGMATTRSEMIWRAAQILLAAFAVWGAYDWETKKLADRQAARDHEAQQAAQSAEAQERQARLVRELDAQRESAEALAAKELAEFKHAADVEIEAFRERQIALEIEKARAWTMLTEEKESAYKADTELKKVELEVANAQAQTNQTRLKLLDQLKRLLWTSSAVGIFCLMIVRGREGQ